MKNRREHGGSQFQISVFSRHSPHFVVKKSVVVLIHSEAAVIPSHRHTVTQSDRQTVRLSDCHTGAQRKPVSSFQASYLLIFLSSSFRSQPSHFILRSEAQAGLMGRNPNIAPKEAKHMSQIEINLTYKNDILKAACDLAGALPCANGCRRKNGKQGAHSHNTSISGLTSNLLPDDENPVNFHSTYKLCQFCRRPVTSQVQPTGTESAPGRAGSLKFEV